ncbi:unnamed protein product [Blepharisma stoltei]|uniref:Uncharacterized protein n=1 Tax=Blepharisma stoltei TaxID=1481888 RepID=A0AAU9JYQ4_9CILI|nr:unnamed protein product [Blepharisma stoltei]
MYTMNGEGNLNLGRALSQGALGTRQSSRPAVNIEKAGEPRLPNIKNSSTAPAYEMRKLDLIDPDFHLRRNVATASRFDKNTEAYEIWKSNNAGHLNFEKRKPFSRDMYSSKLPVSSDFRPLVKNPEVPGVERNPKYYLSLNNNPAAFYKHYGEFTSFNDVYIRNTKVIPFLQKPVDHKYTRKR